VARQWAPPTDELLKRSKGIVGWRQWRGRWYPYKWPRRRGRISNIHQLRATGDFRAASQQTKYCPYVDYREALDLVAGTGYVPRDVLVMAMFGLLDVIILEDGTIIEGVRSYIPDSDMVLDRCPIH